MRPPFAGATGCCTIRTSVRIRDSCSQSSDRSVEMDDRGATVELQPVERSRRGGRSRACEIKNHDDDAIDRLFRAANGYARIVPAHRGMLFPRSDTKYITARRTTWTDRTLELET